MAVVAIVIYLHPSILQRSKYSIVNDLHCMVHGIKYNNNEQHYIDGSDRTISIVYDKRCKYSIVPISIVQYRKPYKLLQHHIDLHQYL